MTEEEYRAIMIRIDELMDAVTETDLAELDRLVDLAIEYENEHFPELIELLKDAE